MVPFRDDDDSLSNGSIYCLKLPDRTAAEAFVRDEPYHRAGLFESVLIRRWRQMVPELHENALLEELAKEKQRLA